jgi:hypothetical protein
MGILMEHTYNKRMGKLMMLRLAGEEEYVSCIGTFDNAIQWVSTQHNGVLVFVVNSYRGLKLNTYQSVGYTHRFVEVRVVTFKHFYSNPSSSDKLSDYMFFSSSLFPSQTKFN